MIYEVKLSRHLFGNEMTLKTFRNGNEAWTWFQWVAKNLKDGQTASLLGHERNNTHLLAVKSV